MTAIPAPTVEYSLLAPVLIISAVAVAGVVIEALAPRVVRFGAQTLVAVVGILVAGGYTVNVWRHLGEAAGTAKGQLAGEGAIAVDGPGVLTWGLLLAFGLLGIGLVAERSLEGGLSAFTGRAGDAPGSAGEADSVARRIEHTEVFPLAMFALLGMMIFAVSNDLITMFVALEVLSLPLYVLCGLARRRRLISQEAALKYFLLGAFSSVFFLYGAALAYGYAGTVRLDGIARAVADSAGPTELLVGSIGLILVGVLFKMGAVPFHSWTPDVYQGAPTPITAFMAAGTKAAATIALLRVLYVAFGDAEADWKTVIAVVAAVSMVFGSLVAIAQRDVKRVLGYSSVANAGFLLVGVAGAFSGGDRITSIGSVLFYLTAYGLASLGAFAVVMLVRDPAGESTDISQWAGLGRTSPWLAGAFTVFMLSFAGIPLTAGFMGKWAVFVAAWSGGLGWLVAVAIVASLLAAYIYLRMIVLMFFATPEGDAAPRAAAAGRLTTVVVVLAAAGTIALGVFPGPALELVQQAGAFVR